MDIISSEIMLIVSGNTCHIENQRQCVGSRVEVAVQLEKKIERLATTHNQISADRAFHQLILVCMVIPAIFGH